jgi:hypothetical protein
VTAHGSEIKRTRAKEGKEEEKMQGRESAGKKEEARGKEKTYTRERECTQERVGAREKGPRVRERHGSRGIEGVKGMRASGEAILSARRHSRC